MSTGQQDQRKTAREESFHIKSVLDKTSKATPSYQGDRLNILRNCLKILVFFTSKPRKLLNKDLLNIGNQLISKVQSLAQV